MRLILRSDVKDVGTQGDVIDVSKGYGRNYLLPGGRALVAPWGAGARAVAMRRSRDVTAVAPGAPAEAVAKKLVNSPVNIAARVGVDDKLFGSITAADIVEAIAAQKDVEIDRKQVVLTEPIKTIGTHLIPVKLHASVEFPVTIEVGSDA